MEDNLPIVSISIPVLNEEANICSLYDRLCSLSERMSQKCDMEFVFSDNHSSDGTWSILNELAQNDTRVKALRFSKNIGFQKSILVNYMHTSGHAVMQVDADLQDPPEMLAEFFDRWKEGYHVVYGIRRRRPESILLSSFRKVGYWIIDVMSEHPIPRNVGDFRLIDRSVVQALSKVKTTNPYLRGMIANLGFKQVGVSYDRSSRTAGESKFNVSRLVRLGLTAVFNHSTVPLRAASFLGVIILTMSVIGAVYYLFLKILHPDLPQGLASIHILVLFGIGLISFLLGIIGEYLLRIYLILRAEPIAVIEKSLNIDSSDLKF